MREEPEVQAVLEVIRHEIHLMIAEGCDPSDFGLSSSLSMAGVLEWCMQKPTSVADAFDRLTKAIKQRHNRTERHSRS